MTICQLYIKYSNIHRYAGNGLSVQCFPSNHVHCPDLGCYSDDLCSNGCHSNSCWVQHVLVYPHSQYGGLVYDTCRYNNDLNTRNPQT